MFQFHSSIYLWLLWIVPVLVALWILSRYIRKKQLQRFGDNEIIKKLMPAVSTRFRILRNVVLLLAITMLVLALARPRFGSSLLEVKRNGIEMIVAIDVSNSMLTRDVQPNRLERTKKSVERLIADLNNDKIGLIVFAGDSYMQFPVTNDYASARMFLQTINPSLAPKQGTAIGSAIDLAINSFSSDNQTGKVLVIFTDGENHEDDPIASAKAADEKGIVIHTVGMGLPKGQPVPSPDGNGFMKDKNGNVVMSKLDESTLKSIAATAHGIYVRTSETNSGLDLISDEINKMQQTKIASQKYADYDEKFTYPAFLAMLLLVIELFIPGKKSLKTRRIDLFNVDKK
ncbi:MAG: VWA domain-containing protein [Bacteroidales bacterium]|nr:VWA domain-containing protein [Bacteroidales bacterium]